MPFKKRKNATAAAVAAEPETPSTFTTSRGTTFDATAATSRPKRSSLMPPPEQPASKKAKTTATTPSTTTTNGDVPEKGRDRPAKAKAEEVIEEAAEELMTPETAEPKKVGRPTKAAAAAKATAKSKAKKENVARRTSRRTSELEPEFSHDDLPRLTRGIRSTESAPDDDEDDVAVEDEPEEFEEPEEPKKRGRPTKGKGKAAEKIEEDEEVVEDESEEPKKRGRPAKRKGKAVEKAEDDETVVEDEPEEPKKRGRPAKGKGKAAAVVEVESPPSAEPEAPAKRGRGRPARKAKEEEAPETKDVEELPQRAHIHYQHVEVERQLEEELDNAVEEEPIEKKKKTKRQSAGVPRNVKGGKKATKAPAVAAVEDEDVDNSNEANATEATTVIANDVDGNESGERQYWLMKAEPESRIEKNKAGVECDIKFTIDDLRRATEPEGWEGIRNPEAQKNMKAMNVGDLAFFYESNTKIPGIVGIMKIVQTASHDLTAFDKNAPYYDPKSDSSKPKWMLVHVRFVRKFTDKISLKELQSFGKTGGVLEGMDLLKRARLSVGKVTQAQWNFIMSLVKDDSDDEEEIGVDNAIDDRGTDFASAFEAPENFGVAEPTSDIDVVDASKPETSGGAPESAAITAAYPPTSDPAAVTTTELTSGTLMGEAAHAVSSIFETVESAVETAANSVVETATGLILGKKATSRAGSKAHSRAGSRSGSAAPRAVSRAKSAVRESIRSVADVVMHQSETIIE